MSLTVPPQADLSLKPEERSGKIHARHLERLAFVYIRQSSMQQVYRNQESTKIQYNLASLAQQLGWTSTRIVTIDEDLGQSGASAEHRTGFQRLLTEVALDHVGVILGAEMSRLARSNKDWHQLLELCARFGTLIADLDGLYDPSRYNDRLLLGLKGTMSEAELHILRQRLLQGKLQKARRGDLHKPVPTGYLLTLAGDVVIDPDEEAQAAIRIVFDAFDRIGTLHGVLTALVRSKVQLGIRLRTGPEIGKLEWRRPHRQMIQNILRNPVYAGAYVYGLRQTDPRKQKPGRPATGKTPILPPDRWLACVHDRLPAYISWEQYERNQMRLNENRKASPQAVRKGSALLQGLIACGKCQRRMTVQYATAHNGQVYARYVCNHAAVNYGATVCGGLSATRLDSLVADLVLAALAPSALKVSMRVSEDLEQRRDRETTLWQKRLERAQYEAERAERQYRTVEPENRLVVRTLEKNWEQALQAERSLQEEYRRHQHQQPRRLTSKERKAILALSSDLPRLWHAPSTTYQDRKSVVRLLVDRVVVTIAEDSEWVEVVIHWAGGRPSTHRMRRPVGKLSQMEHYQRLLEQLRTLRRAGHTAGQIADKLNAEGWVTPTQRNGFNERLVRMMLHRYGPVPRGPKPPPSDNPDEWWLADLANELKMSLVTLYGWMRRGWVKARRLRGQWIVVADRAERRRLRGLRQKHVYARRSRPHKNTS